MFLKFSSAVRADLRLAYPPLSSMRRYDDALKRSARRPGLSSDMSKLSWRIGCGAVEARVDRVMARASAHVIRLAVLLYLRAPAVCRAATARRFDEGHR